MSWLMFNHLKLSEAEKSLIRIDNTARTHYTSAHSDGQTSRRAATADGSQGRVDPDRWTDCLEDECGIVSGLSELDSPEVLTQRGEASSPASRFVDSTTG